VSSYIEAQQIIWPQHSRIAPCPSKGEKLLLATYARITTPPTHSDFRVIPGESFLKHFASDRSHMVRNCLALASIRDHADSMTSWHDPS